MNCMYRFLTLVFFPFLALNCLFVTVGHGASASLKGGDGRLPHCSDRSAVVSDDLKPVSDDTGESELPALASIPIKDPDRLVDDKKSEEREEKIEPDTRKLPVWGEKVRDMGFDLPLPFGAGANFVLMDQGIDIRNVKVGFGDPILEVSGLAFSDARAHDAAITARLDAWLLPLANIYGIFGSINGQTEFDLDISRVTAPIALPPIIEPGKTVDFNIDYNGTTFGGGILLAGGHKGFFGSVDANYTYSNVDIVDGKINTFTISPRLGFMVDPSGMKGSLAFWIGAMYMKYKQTVTDDINLKEFDPRLPPVEIDFKLDVKNDQPYNFLFGGQWEITKRWQFMAEGGVGDRKQLITGVKFRF